MKRFPCLPNALWNSRFRFLLLALSALITAPGPSSAVILYGTGDPTANTSAPGALANSGWQYEGKFGGFLGTAIAANYFITAHHIGGNVGDTFLFNNGTTYTTTAVFPDPSSDLQIWQVSGRFPVFAPLYSGTPGSEVNLSLVVIGRGTQRGGSVNVGSNSHLGGWLWGPGDGAQRWGTNVIGSIENDPTYGNLLRAPFDANGGPNEVQLSGGDSGGAVFVFNGQTSQWELAGINLAVDGPFSNSSSGTSPFDAAMFDTSGLFVQGAQGNWVTAPNPSAFYATEIAAHEAFINSVVLQLVSVVSRKTHGSAGDFYIDLPATGTPGIECRTGGPGKNYTIVFTFMNNISVQGARVTSGTGSVNNFSFAGRQVTVDLTGVADAQTIVIAVSGVNDGTNTGDVSVPMSVLVGDVNADGGVSNLDVSLVKAKVASGATVDSSNFRDDVSADGGFSNLDISIIKAQVAAGAALPSPP